MNIFHSESFLDQLESTWAWCRYIQVTSYSANPMFIPRLMQERDVIIALNMFHLRKNWNYVKLSAGPKCLHASFGECSNLKGDRWFYVLLVTAYMQTSMHTCIHTYMYTCTYVIAQHIFFVVFLYSLMHWQLKSSKQSIYVIKRMNVHSWIEDNELHFFDKIATLPGNFMALKTRWKH